MSKVINSVKFKRNGVEGLEVGYDSTEKSGDFSFPNNYTKKCPAPAHTELKKACEPFIQRAINICHLKREARYETELVSINCKSQGFTISVKVKSDLTGGWFSVTTPFLTEGDYPAFSNLEDEWDILVEEIRAYLSGEVKVNEKQLVMDFNFEKMRTAKDKEEYQQYEEIHKSIENETISPEELLEEARAIIEANGGVAYLPNDLAPLEPELVEVPQTTKKGKGKQTKITEGEDF